MQELFVLFVHDIAETSVILPIRQLSFRFANIISFAVSGNLLQWSRRAPLLDVA